MLEVEIFNKNRGSPRLEKPRSMSRGRFWQRSEADITNKQKTVVGFFLFS
uniref:Uncharacterized protein n=1 Tax=Meloidogyne enterolobii TaxID=390850 RepID=A0A6V7W237_MELEN|nr:unnamed protein product [Meloidogyne enterolobii]